jgi:hypothetical protein
MAASNKFFEVLVWNLYVNFQILAFPLKKFSAVLEEGGLYLKNSDRRPGRGAFISVQ